MIESEVSRDLTVVTVEGALTAGSTDLTGVALPLEAIQIFADSTENKGKLTEVQ